MSEFLFIHNMYFIWNHMGFTCAIQVHSVPKLLCRILTWLGSSYCFFRIMKLNYVYVNDNDLDKFHRIIAALTGPPKACLRCEGLWFLHISNMRHWHRIHKEHQNLDVPRISRFFFLTRHLQSDHHLLLAVSKEMAAKASVIKKKPNKLFHSPGDLFRQYFAKTTWKLRRTRIHQLKRENWQKRETEIEKNRQNWRNILLEKECNPDPRDEVIEFDEERNA